jgi:hypothetical protein
LRLQEDNKEFHTADGVADKRILSGFLGAIVGNVTFLAV